MYPDDQCGTCTMLQTGCQAPTKLNIQRPGGRSPSPKKSSPTLFLDSGVLEIDTVQLEQVRKSPSHSWCDPVIKHIRITPRNVDLLKYDNI